MIVKYIQPQNLLIVTGKTPSCAKLLSILKPKRVIIGSIDTNKIASGGIKTLEDKNINVTTKVLEKEC